MDSEHISSALRPTVAELDLRSFAIDSVRGVFNLMLNLDVNITNKVARSSLRNIAMVGSVSFAGLATGNISIHISREFAGLITAAMLDMKPDEVSAAELRDVVGEVANMVGGNLKSGLCDVGYTCQLSVPLVTSGTDFTVESLAWGRHERFAFRHKKHTAFVEICIKA